MPEEKFDKNTRSFYLIVAAIFLGICSPRLLTQGMFVDGVFYATVARNMAEGLGSFWKPFFSQTLFPVFHEHPPFAIWLQSLLFRIFGDHVMVERFYSVFVVVVAGFLVVEIWRKITGEKSTAWFPLLILISFSAIPWSALNNLLESTMSVFLCAAVWLYLSAVQKKHRLLVVLGGLALFFGVFSKGVAALFPLTLPCFIWIFTRKIAFRTAVTDSILLACGALLPFLFLYVLSTDARGFIDDYVMTQLFPSVTGARETSGTRFYVIWKFLGQVLIPCVILMAVVGVLIFCKKRKLLDVYRRDHQVFLCLALCGVLPIMLSPKQQGHYLLPVYPFFALALALPFQPYVKILMDRAKKSSRISTGLRFGAYALLVPALVVAVSRMGKIGRDKDVIEVVSECNRYIPPNAIINIDPDWSYLWGFYGNFARTQHVSLDVSADNRHQYYLSNQQASVHLFDAETDGGYLLVKKSGNFKLWKYELE